MAREKAVAVQDKRQAVIGKRLEKVGLSLENGEVVCTCPTCGQRVAIPNAVENKTVAPFAVSAAVPSKSLAAGQ
jgi:hypothetical protein